MERKKADHEYLMEKHNDTNDWEKEKNVWNEKRANENNAEKRSTKKKKEKKPKKMNWTSEMKFSLKKINRIYIRVVCVFCEQHLNT